MHSYTLTSNHTIRDIHTEHKLVQSEDRHNKMQLKMADFTPGAATWRTGQNVSIIFDSGQFSLLDENMTSSTKLESQRIALLSK